MTERVTVIWCGAATESCLSVFLAGVHRGKGGISHSTR